MFRIGERFKVTRIRIPFAQAVAANMTLIPKIYTDDGNGTTYTLQTVNSTNYSDSERFVTLRSDSAGADIEARQNFWLELRWSGSALLTVNLPIRIDFEIVNE